MDAKSLNFTRQHDLFDPSKGIYNIHIFGAGSVGSFLALNLAKLGFSQLTVYDYDKVEEVNIPNQFFRVSDIGKFKTEALKEIIKEFSDVDISIKNKKITPENIAELTTEININSVPILAFDDLESREIVYSNFKGYPNNLIDIRMGGKGWESYVIKLDSDEDCKFYEKTLAKKTVDLPCGQKAIIFTLLNIASEVSNLLVKIAKNEKHPNVLKRHMDSYNFLVNTDDKEAKQ